MDTFLLDNFTAADGTLITAHTSDSGGSWIGAGGWTSSTVYPGEIISNALKVQTGNSEGTFVYTGAPGSADYCVTSTLSINAAMADWSGVGCRMPISDYRIGGYFLAILGSQLAIWKMSNGSPFPVLATVSVTVPTGIPLELTINATGSTITGSLKRLNDGYWLNSSGTFQATSTTAITVIDAEFTAAGRAYIHLSGQNVAVDSINGTDSAASATSVTITGPTSGIVGVASTNFTVTLDAASGSSVVITPSDGGAGGTFTPSAVTIAAGSTTGTFTYMAASAGTKTITATNGSGLSNIGSISFVASSSSATAVTMTGPTSGVAGSASTNFSIGANGTITGTVVVTPSDSGAGGTFTPPTVSISSGSPTGTFTYTPASSGAKTISVTNNGALTNPSNITYTASAAPVTIGITDTNIFLSPYNWHSDGAGAMQSNNVKASSSFAWSNMRGAYAKFKATVGVSGYIKLNVNAASLSGLSNSAGAPTLAWSIAGGAVQAHLMATADTQITLASGLSAGTYDVFLWHRSVYITQDGDNWSTPVNRLQITGIELSSGGTLSAPSLKSKKMIVYGDSITEGDINISGIRSANSQDALQTYGWFLSEILDAEVGVVGFYGQTWSWFSSTWNAYSSGKSRLIGGMLSPAPDYVVVNYGENDGNPGPASATVTSDLAAVKTAAPFARIVLNIPFSGRARTNLSAATLPIGAIRTDLARYEMLNGNLQWSFDGQHPNVQGHANLAALLAKQILTTTPTGTARTITLTLVNTGGTQQASLTNLKWAFWEQITPDLLTAPLASGTVESTDALGVIIINVTTQLASGGIGWLDVTNSDGNPATVHKAFSGPVAVS